MLIDCAGLDEAAFRSRFRGTAIKRTGRDRFVRNVLIALGNSRAQDAVPVVENALSDHSPLVRAMAVWAFSQLVDADKFETLRTRFSADESDIKVWAEWVRVS